MSIKVIIANNNDILYSNLSNFMLQNESIVEIIKVPQNKLNSLIYQFKSKDKLIVLDSNISISFCSNIIKNAIHQIGKKENIIILVIDSRNLMNAVSQDKNQSLFKLHNNTFNALFDILDIISNAIKETFDLEKEIDNILWGLGFTSYYKGTIYLKDSIFMVFNNKELLQDVNFLIENVAEKNNAINKNVVRSIMDKTINNVLDLLDTTIVFEVFGDLYDGRKISLKYFLDLCIHYLEKKKYCCLNEKRTTYL